MASACSSNLNGSAFFQPAILLCPRTEVRRRLHDLVQLAERIFHIAYGSEIGALDLIDLRRIDIDMDNLAVLGELGDLAGHAIVEAHAKGQ